MAAAVVVSVTIPMILMVCAVLMIKPMSSRFKSFHDYKDHISDLMSDKGKHDEVVCAVFIAQFVLEEPLNYDICELVDTEADSTTYKLLKYRQSTHLSLCDDYILPSDIEFTDEHDDLIEFKLKQRSFYRLEYVSKWLYYGQSYPYGPPYYFNAQLGKVVIKTDVTQRIPSPGIDNNWRIQDFFVTLFYRRLNEKREDYVKDSDYD